MVRRMHAVCDHWMLAAGERCGRPAGHEPPHHPRSLVQEPLDHQGTAPSPAKTRQPGATASRTDKGGKPQRSRKPGRRRRIGSTGAVDRGRTAGLDQGTGSRQQGDSQSRVRVYAKTGGTCAACSRSYGQGAALGRVRDGWGHQQCADIMAETGRIRAGETFRGRQPSTWRRGAGPSKTRSRYDDLSTCYA